MKRFSLPILALACALLVVNVAHAQQSFIPPGGSALNPPLPQPPPPPRIEVPAIPKMDAPPQQPRVQYAPRGSFSDRISRCLDEGAAAGLDTTERSTYSRSCANRD